MLDFATFVRPASPNTFLIAPAGTTAAAADESAPTFGADAETVRAAFAKVALSQPRVRALSRDDAALQDEYVQESALFRFPDTVTVRFIPLAGGGSTLALYSRSRVGYSDLGVNAKRARLWLALLQEALG